MSLKFRTSFFLISALAMVADAGIYSGKLVELDGKAKSGITVTLKRGGDVYGTALTSAEGAWSIDPSTSASRLVRSRITSGNLVVDGNRRLRVEFGSRDLAGRSRSGMESPRVAMAQPPFRSLEGAVPDTLVYSIGDKVFLRDTISTSADSGIVRIFDTTWNAAIVYGYLKDSRDSNVYRTVKVGTQLWMAQNLAFKRDTSWRYRDSLEMERRYGRMYQWTAAMDTSGEFNIEAAEIPLPWRGICPMGWHIPSDAEWSELVNFADSVKSGKVLKALEFASSGATAATDSLGFRVMAGGQTYWKEDGVYRYVYSAFATNAYFWSASEMTTVRSWGRSFGSTIDHSTRSLYLKTNGHSVRCLAD